MKKILKRSLYSSLVLFSLAGVAGNTETAFAKKATTHKISKKHVKKHQKKHQKATGTTYKANMNAAEQALADQKYTAVIAAGAKNGKTAQIIKKSDKSIDPKMPFNKKNYENEYIYALNHPSLIRGGQGAVGGLLTGITDGLTDFVHYQSVGATKQYAQTNNLDQNWIDKNSNVNDQTTYAYWYSDGFFDNLGGDNFNGAKKNGGQAGLDAYKAGLKLAQTVQDSKINDDLIQYTQANLETTVLAQKFSK